MTGAKYFLPCSRFMIAFDFLDPLTLTPGTVRSKHSAIGIVLKFVLRQGQQPLKGHFTRQLWILLDRIVRLSWPTHAKMHHEAFLWLWAK
jgi:hypothetical protein